ncbi:MAG: N-acetylmuramoyl-L-alanine amidase [Actinomycetota bacterium]
MGQTFLLDLPDVLREAGLNVEEVPGWEFRSRSTGGYDGNPTHLMVHHTASPIRANGDYSNDIGYMNDRASAAPIANLLTPPNVDVTYVLAGGRTNTNGRGVDTWGGGVPLNSMNNFAIGWELAHPGDTRTLYSPSQLRAIRLGLPALCRRYAMPAHHTRGHFEWSPGRKIDPAGPPSPYADTTDRYFRWRMTSLRRDVAAALQGTPPPSGDDDMRPITQFRNSDTRPFGAKLQPNKNYRFGINRAKVPSGTTMVRLNVAVIDPEGKGNLAVWGGGPYPGTTIQQYEPGQEITGSVGVLLDGDEFSVRVSRKAHVLVDVAEAG